MKIEKLIEVFEKLLPIYEAEFIKDSEYRILQAKHIHNGICVSAEYLLDVLEVYEVFLSDGYYKNYVVEYDIWLFRLFPYPKTGKDLKSRIDFMKSEIKSLKRLQKKGFTHI